MTPARAQPWRGDGPQHYVVPALPAWAAPAALSQNRPAIGYRKQEHHPVMAGTFLRADRVGSAYAGPSRHSQAGLDWLNFFVADVQTGFGPFLTAYLATHGWRPGTIGLALTVGTVTQIACQVPGGALQPPVVADLTKGTGRYNMALGGIGAANMIGASLSTTAIGFVVQTMGFTAGFASLSGAVLAGLRLLWSQLPETSEAALTDE